jgi:hypothetical protein
MRGERSPRRVDVDPQDHDDLRSRRTGHVGEKELPEMDAAQLLRYLAALFGLASGVLALLRSLSIDDQAGRRRLTRAGWIFCALLVLGALNGIASVYVEGLKAERSARGAEDARRRERSAQTPLRSVTMTWTFDHVPASVWRRTRERADGCRGPGEVRRHAARRDEFYPFLASLASGRWDDRPVVLLVALDADGANVLPLGMLDARVRREAGALAWNQTDPALLTGVSATIDLRQDLEQCIDQTIRNVPPPVIERPRRCDLRTALTRDGDRVTLRWDLDAVCIAKGVDRADPTLSPTAQLPDQLKMVLLTSIGDFPQSPVNFAAWDKSLLWTPRSPAGHSFSDHSRVTLVANDAGSEAMEYDLRAHPGGTISGQGGGGRFDNEYPLLTTWVGTRPAR